jgi:uncharacterized protein YqhQ
MLSFNYVRALIEKVNMFLLGKDAFSFKVSTYDNDQVTDEFEKAAEKFGRLSLRKLKDNLPDSISYGAIRMVLNSLTNADS